MLTLWRITHQNAKGEYYRIVKKRRLFSQYLAKSQQQKRRFKRLFC